MSNHIDLSTLPSDLRPVCQDMAEAAGFSVWDGREAFLGIRLRYADSTTTTSMTWEPSDALPCVMLIAGDQAMLAFAANPLPKHWLPLAWPASQPTLAMALVHAQGHFSPPPTTALNSMARDHASLVNALQAYGFFDFDYDLSTGQRRSSMHELNLIDISDLRTINHVLSLVHADDAPTMWGAYEQSRLTGCPYRVEARYRQKDGSYRWFRSEGTVFDRSNRHPGRLKGFSRDSQEEVQARTAVQQARFQLERTLTDAGMVSWEWSPASGQRLIVVSNPNLLAAEHMPRALETLIHPLDKAKDAAAFNHALETATDYFGEVRIQHPDTGDRWIRLTGHPRKDDEGRVIGMSGLAMDITERHSMDNELADLHALLHVSLEAGGMYCWEWNLVDGSRRTVGPSQRIIGSSPQTSKESQELVHPLDIEAENVLLEAAIKQAIPYQNQFRILREDGQVRWIYSRANPIVDEAGVVVRLSGVGIDVTERREAELRLEDINRRMMLAMDAAALNPWSVDLTTGTHFSGPLDEALYGEAIASHEAFLAHVVPEHQHLVAVLRNEKFLRSGAPTHLLFAVRHTDGTKRWISCDAIGVCDKAGTPVQLVGVTRDITAVRHAENHLSRTIALLDRVQMATKIAMWEWSEASDIDFYQTEGRELTGDAIPKIHPDDKAKVVRQFLTSIKQNSAFHEEYRIIYPDGHVAWVSAQGRCVDHSTSRGHVVAGVLLDITERKAAESQLAATQDRLKRALDVGGMTTWDWRLPTPQHPNEAFPEYTPATTLGVIHPGDRLEHSRAVAGAINGLIGTYRCEFRVVHQDGSITWLLSTGGRVCDDSGNTIGLSGVAVDITVRKQAEELLAESREWQRVAAAAGELNFWRVDLDSGIRYGGDLDERLYGATSASINKIQSMIHVDDRMGVSDTWLTAGRFGKSYQVEYRLSTPLHGERWLRDRGVYMRVPDGCRQIVGVTVDVTEQHLAQEELKRALKIAKEASASKSGFLAAMSHELRTPLNAVIGYSSLLATSSKNDDDFFYAHSLETSANQLLALINEVLDFSRIEAGALPIEETRMNLESVVCGALDMVSGAAEMKGLCTTLVTHGRFDLDVIGDHTRIRQIVLNLLENAVKFTGTGMVKADLSMLDKGEGRCDVTISVADSGIGISESSLSRLFEPFRQGEESIARHYGGTGLGLSICKRLVELMGGTIEVDSKAGTGSRFTVRLSLPYADAGRRDMQSLFEASRHRVGICVNSEHMAFALSEQLWELGVKVIVIPPSDFGPEYMARISPLSALVVGKPILQKLNAFENWPLCDSGDAPLAIVALMPVGFRPTIEAGRHGQRVIPISRALKSNQFRDALVTATGVLPTRKANVNVNTNSTESSESEHAFGGLRVLVVEDNEVNRTLITLQLETLGIAPYLSDSGRDALAVLQRNACDIVLMDVEMPGMDGMQVTRAIRTGAYLKQPYIVAVTAHVFSGTRDRMTDAGMDDFVSKPVLIPELRAALLRAKAHQANSGLR